MSYCIDDGRCRLSFMVKPGGAAVDVTLDDGTVIDREGLQPVRDQDAQFHTYSTRPQLAGQFANIRIWADGWNTITSKQLLQVGDYILPGFELHQGSGPVPTGIAGNFLALPGFELGFGQKPGLMAWMEPEYRARLKEYGGNTLVVQPYAIYPPWSFDYRNNLATYLHLLTQCKNEGFKLIGMIYNWHRDIDPMWTVDSAKVYADSFIPMVLSLYDEFCYGLECNDFGSPTRIDDINNPSQVAAWENGKGINSSTEILPISQHVRAILGNRKFWLHLAPQWWAPSPRKINTMDEWQFWNAVGNNSFTGLLQQTDPRKFDEFPSIQEQVVHFMYDYKPINGVSGFVGRLGAVNKEIALFEFARTYNDWLSIKNAVQARPESVKVLGYA